MPALLIDKLGPLTAALIIDEIEKIIELRVQEELGKKKDDGNDVYHLLDDSDE